MDNLTTLYNRLVSTIMIPRGHKPSMNSVPKIYFEKSVTTFSSTMLFHNLVLLSEASKTLSGIVNEKRP